MQVQPLVVLAAHRQRELSLLRSMAVPMGCQIIGEYTSGDDALRSIPAREVDIVVVEDDLGNMKGFEFAQSLSKLCTSSILLLQPQERFDYLMEDLLSLDVVVLRKPLNRVVFAQTVDTMMHYRQRMKSLNQELIRLRSDIHKRGLADKAKTMLMNRMKMSESEAWRFLQKASMDSGKPLDAVAQLVMDRLKAGSI